MTFFITLLLFLLPVLFLLNWRRMSKYGPILKLIPLGRRMVYTHGQAANNLVFCGDSSKIANKQTSSIRTILGDRNLLEVSGQDHRHYVGKMDEEIRKHIELHWQRMERAVREFLQNFQEVIEAMWSIPVKLPFTHYSRSLCASSRVQLLKELQRIATPYQDLITCLLSRHDEENKQVVTDKEILHNIMLIMVAGHDTCSDDFYAASSIKESRCLKSCSSRYTSSISGIFLDLPNLHRIPAAQKGRKTKLNEDEFTIFPEPSKFDPTRFEKQMSVPPYSFILFGGGPRICPGNKFARIETLVVIHYLITQYSWELCSDDHYIGDPMLVPTQGLLLQIVLKKQK
ncbi:hypothetical protein ACJRO7_022516 [Eucalyptus globulus]|uniref:Cytochrome P450 n=1 Tax=Eucalyptus globulus TaxID=34317 RepID=A0ABD3K3L9_EUCGL